MEKLTERQREVLDFIRDFLEEFGRPPTLREIGKAVDIKSTNGVNDHLKALESKGFLTRASGSSRGIQLAFSEQFLPGATSVPVLGRVAAGSPILADENISDQIMVPDSFPGIGGRKNVFALNVSGDSMIGDGIFDGDLIFVRPVDMPRQGSIIVARVDSEVTVKRYYREGPSTIRLEPSNPAMKPIIVEESKARPLEIIGAVIGVFRVV